MIRLAVRCCQEQAELVLAELTVLAPNGVEEEHGPGYVEYAIYGGEGELPDVGELEAAAGESLVEVVSTPVPDDWADRWRDFHRPVMVAGRLCVRPSWEQSPNRAEEASEIDPSGAGGAPGDPLDVVVDPGRAFGTGAHPTTRLCLELLLELEASGEASGPLTDLGTGSGVLAIAAAKLGWGPVTGYDHEAAAVEAARANAEANAVDVRVERLNLRESLPALAPTTVANMTSPVLHAVARLIAPRAAPERLLCSGLLPPEVDGVAAAYRGLGLDEVERRREGDWAALLLARRAGAGGASA